MAKPVPDLDLTCPRFYDLPIVRSYVTGTWGAMSATPIRSGGHSAWRCLGVVSLAVSTAWGAFPQVVCAQPTTGQSPAPVVDAYGNARPTYRDRRRTGVFQNDLQRQALTGYQDSGRRTDRRGGFSRFALPGDLSDLLAGRRPRRLVGPLSVNRLALAQREAYRVYGGFGRRGVLGQPRDVRTTLGRRSTLIAATMLNAPVHRATFDYGTGVTPLSTLDQTPFVRSPISGVAAPLDEWLRNSADRAQRQVADEAWAWFGDGEFRSAARAFEAATALEPDDHKSFVGELFCHVSLGATRTAVAVLRKLQRRTENPFLHDLNIVEAYGDNAEIRRVRVGVQWRVDQAGPNPELEALRIIVLWYLGEREEALRSAALLEQQHPDSSYARWSAKISAALGSLRRGDQMPTR